MRIFLAGATGALGRQLLPRLVERGHEVTGMTRSESKRPLVEDLGGRPAVADALDRESVAQAVAAAAPEAIVHQLTAIPHALDLRHFARDFAQTNRLRTAGTDNLLAAARAVGAPAPRRVPRWLGRLLAGEAATTMMTEARGASNARAKRELGWAPRHASWRQGYATGLGDGPAPAAEVSRPTEPGTA